jgi:hypothetical protein
METGLAALVEEAFRGPAWHGPSLWSTLKGVTAEEARWRPAPGRNTIWELVLHAAHGKHLVRRKLVGAEAGTFPRRLRKTWWPTVPEPSDAAAWAADLALLAECHERLMDAIRRPRRRAIRPVVGIALHDTYHAGQIRLIRRLAAGRRASRRPRRATAAG